MDATPIRAVLAGRFTPSALRRYLLTMFSATAALVLVAGGFYSSRSTFSLLRTQISPLGSPADNPLGWPFFSFGVWLLSIASIPLWRFYRRALPVLQARVSGVFLVLYLVAIPAVFTIGLVPPELDITAHRVLAATALGGFGLAFFFSGIGFIISKYARNNTRIPAALIAPFIAYFPLIAIGITSQVYAASLGTFPAEDTWYAWALWEWLLFSGIIAMCVFTSLPLAGIVQKRTTEGKSSNI